VSRFDNAMRDATIHFAPIIELSLTPVWGLSESFAITKASQDRLILRRADPNGIADKGSPVSMP
jgi:hypothetical protein